MYEELMGAGLTLGEAKIYVALVELGKAPAGALSRKTGIHRRNVYDALERMIEKGQVSFIRENNKRMYMALDPQKVLNSIEAKKDALLGVMPLLEAKFNEVKNKQETQFYKGIEGVRFIFEDQLQSKGEILVLGPADYAQKALSYYIGHYTAKRVIKQIQLKIIYTGGQKGKMVPFALVRTLPKQYESPVSLNIYGGKVAIIVWGIEPAAILINNKNIMNAFRNYFNLLWGIARK